MNIQLVRTGASVATTYPDDNFATYSMIVPIFDQTTAGFMCEAVGVWRAHGWALVVTEPGECGRWVRYVALC